MTFGLYAQIGLPEFYHTFDEMKEEVDILVEQYPDLIKVEQIGWSSGAPFIDPIPIWAVKISDNVNVDEDEPEVLFVGSCHAEEVIGNEIVIHNIKEIMDNYYIYPFSQYVQRLEIWFILSVNPEGISVVMDGTDLSYRKNMTDCNNNGIFDFEDGQGSDIDGVDPNRNYDYNWIHGYRFMEEGGTEWYDYFRGFEPFGNGGVAALRDFAEEHHIIYSINWHSSRSGLVSEKVYYPYQWFGVENRKCPDFEISKQIGETVASKIEKEEGGSFYLPSASKNRVGTSTPWFYNEHGTFQLTIETSNLQPSTESSLNDIIAKCSEGAEWILQRATKNFLEVSPLLTGKVFDAETGEPLFAEIIVEENHSQSFRPRMTDSFGRYWRPLTNGTYTVTARKKGYQSITKPITVNNSGWTVAAQANFELEPLAECSYSGIVTCSGNPINATITISDIEEDDVFDVVNGSMNFTVFAGEHNIRVEAEGCFPYIGSFEANSNGSNNFDIDLQSENIVFNDDFENGTSNWIIDGPWQIITDNAFEGSAITDSWDENDGFYAPNCDVNITTSSPISLESEQEHLLTFQQYVYTEDSFDFVKVEVSTDNQNWNEIYNCSGQHDYWNKIYISLNEFAGNDVFLRFRLTADTPDQDLKLVDPGWTIDNIKVISGNATANDNNENFTPTYNSTLFQNYPNPFNPETTINFIVSEKNVKEAKIDIFNIKGEKVKSFFLNDSDLSKGNVVWNAKNVSTGIYFYKLSVNNKTIGLKKACLIK